MVAIDAADPDIRRISELSVPLVEPPTDRIDIRISENPIELVVVAVRMAGADIDFLLDTGAQCSVVTQSVLNGLELPSDAVAVLEVGASSGEKQMMPFVVLPPITTGKVKCTGVPAMVIPDEALQVPARKVSGNYQIQGIIGWDILRHIDFAIDLPSGCVTINPPDCRPASPKNALSSAFPVSLARDANNSERVFGVDTGGRHSWLSRQTSLLTNHPGAPTIDVEEQGFLGRYETNELLIDNETIHLGAAEITFRNITTGFTDFIAGLPFDGVIGSDVFRQCAGYFFMSSNRFYMSVQEP